MKKGSTLFLKLIICLIALGSAAILIRFPQTEGRAANLDLISIYTDPFIIYMYFASIPFFIALVQAFKLLGFVDKNQIFSPTAVKAIKNVKYCALAIVAFIVGSQAYLFIVEWNKSDDIAGGVMMGFIIMLISVIIATAAAIFQRLLQNAVDLKSENDLTV